MPKYTVDTFVAHKIMQGTTRVGKAGGPPHGLSSVQRRRVVESIKKLSFVQTRWVPTRVG
jgi:hypothetical protein